MLNKMAISKFWSVDFGKNTSVGGGLDALQFFWSLKKGTRTFHFRLNEPSHDILGRLGWYDHPWEKNNKKNKKTNKHASVICLLAKNAKFHIFVDRSLKLLQ